MSAPLVQAAGPAGAPVARDRDAGASPEAAGAGHRERLRGGSRSFFAASLLLPRELASRATVLYAWCRVADDAIDESPDPARALEGLRARLRAIDAGMPGADPVDRDMAALMGECRIAVALPAALLGGFAWDVESRSYASIGELRDYGARVAGAVGVMMALLMSVREPNVLARAADLGVAMQLTNIARDVAEDARRGRLYLPRDWMREAGLEPESWLRDPTASPALNAVVARLLAHADTLYDRAASGIAALPASSRPGMHAARLLYAEIGAELLRRGGDPFAGRAVVPPLRKGYGLLRALAACAVGGVPSCDPALPETGYLVRAVGESPAQGRASPMNDHPVLRGSFGVQAVGPATGPTIHPAAGFRQACLGVFHLLERLERDARTGRGAP